MPSKYVYTEVDGRKLRLSNLHKLIYPEAKITKAEIIQYYIDIADRYFKFNKNRPTTLIRFPDGIQSESFYSKSAPDWSPDWIKLVKIKHSKESINYIVPSRVSDLVWIANISGIEHHPTQMRFNKLEEPDHFIFDLDPSDTNSFDFIKEIAVSLKSFLNRYGYSVFLKTSGSRGLHLYIPIKEGYSHDQMTDSCKNLAQEFIKLNKDSCTLHLKKEKRKGRLLIDIYRNYKAQTTVAPYSLRAKKGAPISMPIAWEQLDQLQSSNQYTLRNYKELVNDDYNPWIDWDNQRADLHTIGRINLTKNDSDLPQQLDAYRKKRNFESTLEPKPLLERSDKQRFVIQLHDATNLHYDLRIEKDGSLLSWALPKGFPLQEGEKRLAIKTENHPTAYLQFEGKIPKDDYGGGEMWIVDSGKFEWRKDTLKHYSFDLNGKNFQAKFNIYNTDQDLWLIERIEPFTDYSLIKPTHMLAQTSKNLIKGEDWQYEIKWDGIRVFIIKDEDQLIILSRNGKDLSGKFPEVLKSGVENIRLNRVILDAELVCLDHLGRPVFSNIISRMHTQSELKIQLNQKSNPAVCYVFDVINIDGIDLTQTPLYKRQGKLNGIIKLSDTIRISEVFTDGESLLAAAKQMDLEGIMMKNKYGRYSLGKRSEDWKKLKFRTIESCYIIGYTEGKGDRKNLFGSLHLMSAEHSEQIYRGRVGSGFDTKKMKSLLALMNKLVIDNKPINIKVEEESRTKWIKAQLSCEIQFASITENGTFREPIFVKLRDDK